MNITYKSHYFTDPVAKAAFERYAIAVFGLDFTLWKSRGLWDENYIPFSAFDGGECIATICVFPAEVTVHGKKERWAQLLTVGTLPEYRKRGIQRKLWTQAETWIKENCTNTFLFTTADDDPADSAAGFYHKLGFTRLYEKFEVVNYKTVSTSIHLKYRKLNLDEDNDFELLYRLSHNREPVSNRLGIKNPNLSMFMYLYVYKDWTYYFEKLDTIIVVEDRGNCMRVHDIMAVKMPVFDEIKGFFGIFGIDSIEFFFCTDKIRPGFAEKRIYDDETLFVTDTTGLDGDFIFPSTARA